MINIVTINYFLSGDNIVNTTIDGDETLLDADLVIADPLDFNSIWLNYISRNGTNLRISSPYSDKVYNIFASRKKEIGTLLNIGKVIVVFVRPITGFNGEVDNTGRYEPVIIYDFLPIDKVYLLNNLKSGKSGANNSMVAGNSKSPFMAYFKALKGEIEYSAYLDIEPSENPQYLILNRSKKPVGFTMQQGKGLIVFLPPPNHYNHENTKLLSTLISCAKKHLTKHETTPPPNWISDYKIKGEEEIDKDIDELNQKLEDILILKQGLENKKAELTKYKSLLFEQGPELENIVIEAFKLFGFKAENRKLDDLEHDVVFESIEGKGIAEIEGKDNDSIHIQKLDQLNRAVDEDFELTGKYPQGILIGNHYRFSKPSTRKEPFSEKVHIVARKKNFGLLSTVEIYQAVVKIIENPQDQTFKTKCRINLLKTTGDIIKLE